MSTLKLRQSQAAPTSPQVKHATLHAKLTEKLVTAYGSSVPVAQHKHYYQYISATVKEFIAGHAAISQLQYAELQSLAQMAATKLSDAAASMPSRESHKTAVAPLESPLRRPATVSTFAIPASPVAAAGAASLSAASSRPPTADKSPSSQKQLTVTDVATKTLSELTTVFGEIPEPEYFARQRKKKAMLAACEEDVRLHQLERQKYHQVDEAFARATGDMVRRGELVEKKQKESQQEKLNATAKEIRDYMKVRQEYLAKAKAEKLREEDELLRRLKVELDAELAHAADLREKERQGILLSVAENEKLRLFKIEQQKNAVLEAKRLQNEYVAKEAAAEAAHKQKYINITLQQEKLAKLLEERTAPGREAQARLERLSEEYAIARDKAAEERERAKKARQQANLQDQVKSIREAMSAKEKERLERKRADRDLAIVGSAEILAGRDMAYTAKATDKANRVTYRKALAEQLKTKKELEQMQAQAAVTNLFFLKTASSDLDLEAAFERGLKLACGIEDKKSNNSEGVAPILGYGAPFVTAIEKDAESKFEETKPAVADPLATMKPKVCYVPPPHVASPLSKH